MYYETKSKLFISACKALGNPAPLGPVSSAPEHKLLSFALPLEGLFPPAMCHCSSGAWEKPQGRKKTDGERERKVPLISLYLLFSEEETLFLTLLFITLFSPFSLANTLFPFAHQ